MNTRIAVDMDEVLADTLGKLLAVYNRDHGTTLTKESLTGRSLDAAVPAEHGATIHAYLSDRAFFRDIPVMPDSQTVLHALTQRYEIFVASAAMEYPTCFDAKYEWMREHFPFIPKSRLVFCGDKSIVNADYLIDDSPNYLARFQGQGILFTAPDNLHETRYPRVNDWQEVRQRFL